MTLDEVARTLPNGFHDSEITGIKLDYESRTAKIRMSIWVGSMNDPDERREAYRRAELYISGLCWWAMDPPDPKYPFQQNTRLTVDGFVPDAESPYDIDPALERSLTSKNFMYAFWVIEWNAFIHFAAAQADLKWASENIEYR